MSNGQDRMLVEVTQQCYAYPVMSHDQVPHLIVNYGGYEFAFTAGPQCRSVPIAREFAIELAHAALGFAAACNHVMIYSSAAPVSMDHPTYG